MTSALLAVKLLSQPHPSAARYGRRLIDMLPGEPPGQAPVVVNEQLDFSRVPVTPEEVPVLLSWLRQEVQRLSGRYAST